MKRKMGRNEISFVLFVLGCCGKQVFANLHSIICQMDSALFSILIIIVLAGIICVVSSE